MISRLALLVGAAACASGLPAHARDITLTVGALEGPGVSAQSVRAVFRGPRLASAVLDIERLGVAGRTWRNASLTCASFAWTAEKIVCPGGTLSVAEKIPLDFTYVSARRELFVESRPTADESWRISGRFGGKAPEVDVKVEKARLNRLSPWLPPDLPKVTGGHASGTLSLQGEALTSRIDVDGLGFADASGLHAGEKIAATLEGEASRKGEEWRWKSRVAWRSGEVFWQPLFVSAKGHHLELEGTTARGVTRIEKGQLRIPDVGTVAFKGEWDHSKGALAGLEASSARVSVAALYGDLLKPLLQGSTLAALRAEGLLSFNVRANADAVTAFEVELNALSFEDTSRRFAVFGLSGRVPWRRDEATKGELTLKGAEFLKVPVGSVRVPLRLRGMRVDIDDMRVPVLDGGVRLREFAAGRASDGWRWRFKGEIEPISMVQLTQAFALPVMHGSLAGVIPEVRYRNGTITMDGALAVRVFDGAIGVTNMELIEPFGRAPRLHADADFKNLDLELLTRAFDFGSITGRVDAQVRGLELVGSQPVRFDARLESSPGRYPRRISQRAVQNISALGGAGATAAIQRSLLRFFDEFGYDRLGFSCKLENNVCEMDGIERAPQGYIIVKGGGIPAISVIGYNRAIDWRELVDRLKRVTQQKVKPIVK